ncbi:MAG: hypothetical protein MR416_05550, partial [Lachnospiraceae bacterium]|nr:hypothetical protein [Lachnospiraceae bacterium]
SVYQCVSEMDQSWRGSTGRKLKKWLHEKNKCANIFREKTNVFQGQTKGRSLCQKIRNIML